MLQCKERMCSLSSHVLLSLWTVYVPSLWNIYGGEHRICSGHASWCILSLLHFSHLCVHVLFPPIAGLDPQGGPDPVHTYNYVIITSPDTSGWCRAFPRRPPGPVSWGSHLQPSTAKGYLLLSLAGRPLWNKERWIKASQAMKSYFVHQASSCSLHIFLVCGGNEHKSGHAREKEHEHMDEQTRLKTCGRWKKGAGSKDMRK